MPVTRTVLIFDDAGESRAPLAERLRRLGFRGLRAKTPEAARGLLEDPRYAIGAAILPPELPLMDLRAVLADYRARAPEGRLGYVVAGVRPGAEARRRLEEAGVELALWEPFPDAALRFQLNRALDAEPHHRERRALRVPLARKARILTPSSVKTAPLYTLSAGGAFIETPRPSPRQAHLSLELVLPERDVGVEARVLYTNVPGNLHSDSLPLGMGVGFTRMAPEAQRVIEHCVSATALDLRVGDPGAARRRGDRSWFRRFLGRA